MVSELGQLGYRLPRQRDRRGDGTSRFGELPQRGARVIEGTGPGAYLVVGGRQPVEADRNSVKLRQGWRVAAAGKKSVGDHRHPEPHLAGAIDHHAEVTVHKRLAARQADDLVAFCSEHLEGSAQLPGIECCALQRT